MNVLTDEGKPREGICITCPECGEEVNLSYSAAHKSTGPGDEPWVEFEDECICGVRIAYRKNNPGADARRLHIEVD